MSGQATFSRDFGSFPFSSSGADSSASNHGRRRKIREEGDCLREAEAQEIPAALLSPGHNTGIRARGRAHAAQRGPPRPLRRHRRGRARQRNHSPGVNDQGITQGAASQACQEAAVEAPRGVHEELLAGQGAQGAHPTPHQLRVQQERRQVHHRKLRQDVQGV